MKRVLLVITALAVYGGAAAAQAPARPLQLALDLGFVNTSGNSDVTTFNLGQKLGWTRAPWSVTQTAAVIYGETDGRTTAETYDASVRVDRVFRERLSAFALATYQRNPFAGVASRYGEGLGIAFRAIRAPRDSLTLEGAVSVNQERSVAAVENSFAAARSAVAFKHLFGAAAHFIQTIEWLANLDDSRDQRVNSETAVTAPLSRQVALKAAYVIRYDRQPEPGFETTDRTLTTGVQIVF
jgi:putative salt-induced outer membrane protein YdiY